jgi:hypothetical protein
VASDEKPRQKNSLHHSTSFKNYAHGSALKQNSEKEKTVFFVFMHSHFLPTHMPIIFKPCSILSLLFLARLSRSASLSLA